MAEIQESSVTVSYTVGVLKFSYGSATLTSLLEIEVSTSRGNLMYSWYAALSHRPNVFIVESSIPTAAAVVAAPIRKLWPAYLDLSRPTADKALHTSCTNLSLAR